MDPLESLGESSSKRQENGDALTSTDRPLKKARFAWQVKGKHHLKEELEDKPDTSEDHVKEESHKDEVNSMDCGQTIGMADLDAVIADAEQSLLEPKTETSESSNSDSEPSFIPNSMSLSRTIPDDFTEDQCIARWQARQMAKGFVDNTINRVLDTWVHLPLPEEDNPRFLALDVADFINNLPEDNSVENEGILMAISAHGLQNNSSSSSNNDSSTENASSSNARDLPLLPPGPTFSAVECRQFMNTINRQDEDDDEDDIELERDILWYNEHRAELQAFALDTFSGPEQYDIFGPQQAGNHDQLDFLEAAVLHAIQSKGLATFDG